jgi:hypothetical protein
MKNKDVGAKWMELAMIKLKVHQNNQGKEKKWILQIYW